MDAIDVLRTKRDGGRLTPEQIRWVIGAYTEGAVPDEQMSALLMAIAINSPSGRYDQLYLSNFATLQVKDALARIAGDPAFRPRAPFERKKREAIACRCRRNRLMPITDPAELAPLQAAFAARDRGWDGRDDWRRRIRTRTQHPRHRLVLRLRHRKPVRRLHRHPRGRLVRQTPPPGRSPWRGTMVRPAKPPCRSARLQAPSPRGCAQAALFRREGLLRPAAT